jgi:hypothetical protein
MCCVEVWRDVSIAKIPSAASDVTVTPVARQK